MINRATDANSAPDTGELYIALQHLNALLQAIEESASCRDVERPFLFSQIGKDIAQSLLQQFDEEVRHD